MTQSPTFHSLMGSDRHGPSLMSSQPLGNSPFTVPVSDHCPILIRQVDSRLPKNKGGSAGFPGKGSEKARKPRGGSGLCEAPSGPASGPSPYAPGSESRPGCRVNRPGEFSPVEQTVAILMNTQVLRQPLLTTLSRSHPQDRHQTHSSPLLA